MKIVVSLKAWGNGAETGDMAALPKTVKNQAYRLIGMGLCVLGIIFLAAAVIYLIVAGQIMEGAAHESYLSLSWWQPGLLANQVG